MIQNHPDVLIEYSTPLHMKILWAIISGFLELTPPGQILSSFLFRITPKKYKRGMALRLISVSTHYFIYQWSSKYPKSMRFGQILEAEHKRNIDSRKDICDQLLKKYLKPDMTALDFGCGPGYVAFHTAKHVKKVFGADISQTAVLCAREVNNSDNISYFTSKEKSLAVYENSSIDLIYSFAVIQHLREELFEGILKEFNRILKADGKIICHIILDEGQNAQKPQEKRSFLFRYLRKKLMPPMICRSEDTVRKKIKEAGFMESFAIPIDQISSIKDDIGCQHLFIFNKA